MFIKLDREYELKCTLGTIKEIEARFNKPFFTLLGGIDKMTTTEQIRLLYIGAHRADSSLEESAFIAACDDCLGLGELTEYLEQFVLALQYPTLTREEAHDRLKKLTAGRETAKTAGSTGRA